MQIENRGQHKLHFSTAAGYLVIVPGISEIDAALWAQACEQFEGRSDGPEALAEAGVLVVLDKDKQAPKQASTPKQPEAQSAEQEVSPRIGRPDRRWGHAKLLQYALDAGLDVEESMSKAELLATIEEGQG